MFFPSAIITNSITNALHALCLLTYFCATLYQYKRKIPSLIIVFLFFFMLIAKILGVIGHYLVFYLSDTTNFSLWIAISLCSIAIQYCYLYGQRIPDLPRRLSWLITLALNGYYIFLIIFEKNIEFQYIALGGLATVLVAAYYAKGLTRTGFLGIAFSNIFWVTIRESINFYYKIDLEMMFCCTYDNDFYHIFLIISTFILYLSLIRGDWNYPEKIKVF